MPFLRVVRDKRGYETTYLVHWYREGHRQRSRILYVFRTPGGVRVGRTPLEPDVLRRIEAEHPHITFDWNVIRDNQQIVEPSLEPRRRRPPPVSPAPLEREPDLPSRNDAAAELAAQGGELTDDGEQRHRELSMSSRPLSPSASTVAASDDVAAQPAGGRSRLQFPSAIEGATADEQIAFLNQWYPALRDGITARISDPVRREALYTLAERLNPAAWTDADQITSGLQEAALALERLSLIFANRRRRSRRRGPDRPLAGGGTPSSAAES